jgi:hypothetical protein
LPHPQDSPIVQPHTPPPPVHRFNRGPGELADFDTLTNPVHQTRAENDLARKNHRNIPASPHTGLKLIAPPPHFLQFRF